MSLRARVTVLAITGVLIIAAVSLVIGSRYSHARAAGEEMVTKLQPAADDADSLVVAIDDMDRGLHEYVLTQAPRELAPYYEGSRRSAAAINSLHALLSAPEQSLSAGVLDVAEARGTWITTVARPQIDAVEAGRLARARAISLASGTRLATATLRAAASQLQDAIDSAGGRNLAALTSFSNQLGLALAGGAVTLLAALAAMVALLGRWVLRPLDQLRRQLRDVARRGRHEDPIVPRGPPELRAAGDDAEEMRRQLVAEIDEARMAREGLKQEGPVVAAIRGELTRPPVADVAGAVIYGDLQPAEGVLAGDWWDAIRLPDGRTALVVTDVSGHGPEAGIAGLRVKTTLTTALEAGVELAEAFGQAADLFAGTPARFATCVVVALRPETGEVSWVNAGHPAPLLSPASGPARELAATGPLLSALGGSWTQGRTRISPDELLVIWTDGLAESHDPAGAELTSEGLSLLLSQARTEAGSDPAEVVAEVLAAARQRAVDWRRDDVTLVIARLSA